MESQAEALGQLTSDDLEGKVVIISCNFKFICMHYMLSLEMNEYKLKGKRKLDLFYLNLFLWETGSKDPSPSLLHLRDVQNSVN